MASIFRRTYKRPIPQGAEIVTLKGRKAARWKTPRGRTRTAPLSPDGKRIVLQYRCWYIAYDGAEGRRIMVKGFTDRAATEELARDKVRLAERIRSGCVQVDLDRSRMDLDDAVEAWTDDLRRRGRSEDYVYNMDLLMTRMGEAFRWPTLEAIRSDSLQSWLADLQSGRAKLPCRKERGPATLSGRSLNQYLETARAFINWCCSQRPLPWLPSNPLAGVEPADESEKRCEKRALTLEVLGRLREASGPRWVIYLTAALTGLRRLELKRMQWGDVLLNAPRPYIQLRAAATKARRADVGTRSHPGEERGGRLLSEVHLHCCRDILEDVAGLLTAGFDDREHRLDKTAATWALRAE